MAELDGDWSSRHARLRIELFIVSIVTFCISNYWTDGSDITLFFLKLDKIPREHVLSALSVGWVYLFVHLWFRTFVESFHQTDFQLAASRLARALGSTSKLHQALLNKLTELASEKHVDEKGQFLVQPKFDGDNYLDTIIGESSFNGLASAALRHLRSRDYDKLNAAAAKFEQSEADLSVVCTNFEVAPLNEDSSSFIVRLGDAKTSGVAQNDLQTIYLENAIFRHTELKSSTKFGHKKAKKALDRHVAERLILALGLPVIVSGVLLIGSFPAVGLAWLQTFSDIGMAFQAAYSDQSSQ